MSQSNSKLHAFITLNIRLDLTNYMLWRSQILDLVNAHGYEDIPLCITESIPTLDVTNESLVKWHHLDQLLLSCLARL